MKCELVDPDGLIKQLRVLKSINVDGIKVDCWWGIVEAHAPQEYNWSGYKRLFQIVRELKLKLQVDSLIILIILHFFRLSYWFQFFSFGLYFLFPLVFFKSGDGGSGQTSLIG